MRRLYLFVVKVGHIFKGFYNWLFDIQPEYYYKRMKICKACTKDPVCPVCGCFLEAKTRVEEEKCPIDKW